jgi:hypothetical protein
LEPHRDSHDERIAVQPRLDSSLQTVAKSASSIVTSRSVISSSPSRLAAAQALGAVRETLRP